MKKEYDQAWLVAQVISGKVNHQDYLASKVHYCNRCNEWEYYGALTMCMLNDAVEKAERQGYSDAVDAISYLSPQIMDRYKVFVGLEDEFRKNK